MPCDGKNDNCERRRDLLSQLKCLISSMDRKKPCEWDENPCAPPLCAVRTHQPTPDCPILLKPCKSFELRSSIMYRCECIKRNGLQDRCMMWNCMGRPECMTKLYPVCGPGRAALLKLTDLGDMTVALQKFYNADQARESALAAYCRLACPDVNAMIPQPCIEQQSSCQQSTCAYPSFIQLANINEVINGLYEALVKVRYPGVTNIECGNLENTLLAQNDRNKLLHWLLVQSLRAISSTADEPGADDESLVKWYVQLGICDNKAALLGKCLIKEQLDTLARLTTFVMNVLGVNGEKKVIPDGADNILDRYLHTEINLIPTSCKLTTKLGYNEAKRYMKKLSESVKEQARPISAFTVNKDISQDVVEGKTDPLDEQALSASVETVEKFCTAFQDINKWTKVSEESTDTSTELIDNYMGSIDNNFSTLKETLQNKNDILTGVIPTGLDVGVYPLDQIIQDTVIGLEELQKVSDRLNDN